MVGGVAYKVFLDSGYALGNTFITPFSRRRQLTPQEISFNRYNANVRSFVRHLHIALLFTHGVQGSSIYMATHIWTQLNTHFGCKNCCQHFIFTTSVQSWPSGPTLVLGSIELLIILMILLRFFKRWKSFYLNDHQCLGQKLKGLPLHKHKISLKEKP